jgi:hypothetical protein
VAAAPPKGLDEEEFEYIQDLESKKEDVERRRQAQHEEDLAKFRTEPLGIAVLEFGPGCSLVVGEMCLQS